MSQLFIRKAYFDVFKNGTEKADRFEGRVLDRNGYDFSFNVSKTKEKEPNQNTIEIYGLSEDTRRKFDTYFDRIGLYAGYGNDAKLIGIGDISEIKHIFDSNSIKTTITFEDGANNYRAAFTSKSYPAGTKYIDVIKDLAGDMNLTLGKLDGIDSNLSFVNGVTLHGHTKKYFNELAKSAGVEFFIQNEQIIIKNANTKIGNFIPEINQDSGLIGTVEKKIRRKATPIKYTKKGKITKSQPNEHDNEIQFSILLNPEINVGTLLYLNTYFIKGHYIVQTVTHSGATYNDEFKTDITAKLWGK